MKVIALSGLAESGKTTTMNELLKLFPSTIQPTIVSNKIQLGNDLNDFMVEFTYNKQLVGIVSAGDPCRKGNQMVQEPILRQYYKRNFDVIICVCRSNGKTVELLVKTIFSTIKVEFVKKIKGAFDDVAIANQIFNKI